MQPSHALQTLASGQRQRQLPSVVIVARRLLLATANGSQNPPTGAATYRPSKLTPTGHRNRRATDWANIVGDIRTHGELAQLSDGVTEARPVGTEGVRRGSCGWEPET